MMNRIEKSINNLNSSNRNTRCEACEELRVVDNLPESAITALEAATNDPDPQVADAAKRALAVQRLPPSSEDVILNDVQEREKSMAQTKGKARNMLLISLPIFIVCGGIAFGLLFFLWFLYEDIETNRWEKFLSPPEKIATIVDFYRFGEVLVETEAGDRYMCDRTACLPYEVWTENNVGFEDYYHEPCDEIVDQDMDYPPRGKIIESCHNAGPGMGATVVLLEDNSLWLRWTAAPVVPQWFFSIMGIVLGSIIGLIVWIPWAIFMAIKARRKARQATS